MNFIDRYSNIILLFFISFFSIILIISTYKIFDYKNPNYFFYYIYLAISLLNIILIFYFLFLQNYKKNFLIIFYILCLAIFYSIEVYLVYKPNTIWEEYERVKEKNIEIIPHTNKRYYESSLIENIDIYTLAGVSNVGMVLTNENGYYPLIERDQYGWHNPNHIYSDYQAVAIGNSFVEGWSVKSSQNITSVLNKLGLNTINLGFAKNSPLHMYAVFREYVMHLKPKYIFWFYTDGDLYELEIALNDNFLVKYLDDKSFNQNLIDKQQQIDIAISDYVIDVWNKQKLKRVRKYINIEKNRNIYFRTFKLTELRERLGMQKKIILIDTKKKTEQKININDSTINNYEKIIKDISIEAKKFQSKIFFVYLPSKSMFSDEKMIIDQNKVNLDKILNIIKKNDIAIINLFTLMRNKYKDPKKIYSKHLKKEGYKFIANSLSQSVNTNNF